MAPKPKQTVASSSAVAASSTVGGSSSQEAPISGKWKDYRHWEHEEALSS